MLHTKTKVVFTSSYLKIQSLKLEKNQYFNTCYPHDMKCNLEILIESLTKKHSEKSNTSILSQVQIQKKYGLEQAININYTCFKKQTVKLSVDKIIY